MQNIPNIAARVTCMSAARILRGGELQGVPAGSHVHEVFENGVSAPPR
jgi:ABC-type uncharacterized transport system ATPase subunit